MMLFDGLLRSGVWLRRRKRWLPWAFIVSVVFALMITPPFTMIKNTVALTVVSLFVAGVGFAVRYLALQRRSVSFDDIVDAGGIYSVVRYPIYLSNILIMLSLTLYVGVVWYMVFASLVGWIVVERIILNEESACQNKYGDRYLQWAKSTRCVIPVILNWEQPRHRVGFARIMRSESRYLLFTFVGFGMINLLKNIMIDFSFGISIFWLASIFIVFIAHLLFRFTHQKRD